MKQYKNTGVWLASSSATAKALEARDTKLAERTFRETTERFEKQFPNKEDRDWFMAMSKGVKPASIEL